MNVLLHECLTLMIESENYKTLSGPQKKNYVMSNLKKAVMDSDIAGMNEPLVLLMLDSVIEYFLEIDGGKLKIKQIKACDQLKRILCL